MERSTHQASFRSTAFPPTPEEAELGDDVVHGLALATWAASELRAAGIEAGEPFSEDHGAMVSVPGPGRVAITCSAVEPGADEHVLVVEDVPRRFRTGEPGGPELAQRAAEVVGAALAAHPDVTELTWVQGGTSSAA
jgi:hypothetical protein